MVVTRSGRTERVNAMSVQFHHGTNWIVTEFMTHRTKSAHFDTRNAAFEFAARRAAEAGLNKISVVEEDGVVHAFRPQLRFQDLEPRRS